MIFFLSSFMFYMQGIKINIFLESIQIFLLKKYTFDSYEVF